MSSQTLKPKNKLQIKYQKLKQDRRLLRLKLNAISKRMKIQNKKYIKLNAKWNFLWTKLDQCIVLKSLVLRLLYPTKQVNNTIRSFTQSLHYYSSKAHNFVRNNLRKLIPSERTIQNWTHDLKLQPGFIEASLSHLKFLKESSNYNLFCSLQFDEMHIREQIISTGGSFEGYVNYGGYFQPRNPKKIANSVIVFMAVGINSNWKVPIAFFYTKGLPAKFLTTIIPECLSRLENSGIICKALVSDGLASNKTCMRNLGAKLDPEDPKPWIIHPNGNDKVYVIMDICHMIKLLRNL